MLNTLGMFLYLFLNWIRIEGFEVKNHCFYVKNHIDNSDFNGVLCYNISC